MTIQRPWALWVSGFLAAVCAVHAIPLIVRHDLVIGGVHLSTPTTIATAVICLVASLGTWKMSRG